MRSRGRPSVLLTALMVVILLMAGCTGSGRSGPGISFSDDELREIAQRWIDESSGLTDMLREEIFFESLRRAGRVAHVRYIQAHGNVRVRGAFFVVHVLADGSVQGASNSLITALPADNATEELTQQEATDIAVQAVTGTVQSTRVDSTWVQAGGVLRLGWQVFIVTRDPRENWSVVVDATDGSVLSVDTLSSEGFGQPSSRQRVGLAQPATPTCQPTQAPGACVFVPDPVNAAGGPLGPEAADTYLVPVDLPSIPGATFGTLANGWVTLAGPPRPGYQQSDGMWGVDGRSSDDFAAGMAYYWITYTQQLMTSLGYPIHDDDPIEIVPIDEDSPDNAFYLFEEDRISLGVDSNGIRAAEDANVIIHEYGHGLLHAAVPDIRNPEGGAFHEATGDVLALLTTLEFRRHDPACLSSWFIGAGQECLRRADSDKVYPDAIVNQVHDDGEIYTGALWDLLVEMLRQSDLEPSQCADGTNPCGPVRDRLLSTFLGSLGYLTPVATLHDAATAFRLADVAQNNGTMVTEIDEAFAAHGLATGQAPTTGNDGTPPQNLGPTLTLDIGHESVGDLRLELRVQDGNGQTICSAVLATPDPTLELRSFLGDLPLDDDTCAQHLPPSSSQQWQLLIADTVPGSEGHLVRAVVSDGTAPYPALGLPASIPDGDVGGIVVPLSSG